PLETLGRLGVSPLHLIDPARDRASVIVGHRTVTFHYLIHASIQVDLPTNRFSMFPMNSSVTYPLELKQVLPDDTDFFLRASVRHTGVDWPEQSPGDQTEGRWGRGL